MARNCKTYVDNSSYCDNPNNYNISNTTFEKIADFNNLISTNDTIGVKGSKLDVILTDPTGKGKGSGIRIRSGNNKDSKQFCDSLVCDFKVTANTASGRTEYTLRMNKNLVNEVRNIFNDILNEAPNFIFTQPPYCYGYRESKNSEGKYTGKLSSHAYGTAIDINQDKNPYTSVKDNKDYGNQDVRMRNDNHKVVKIFDSYGWGWGGNFGSSYDYMHFSKDGR